MSISISSFFSKLDLRMRPRAWVRIFLAGLFSMIAFVALVNFIIDPYQQYRMATLYDVYYSQSRARYLNAGLAKSQNYRSVIIGTSHTANFRLREVQEKIYFRQPVKLIIPLATAYEVNITLATIFEHRNVEAVLYGLDTSVFNTTMEVGFMRRPNTFPMYLYENGIYSHIRYLARASTFLDSVSAVRRSMQNRDDILFSYDRMYEWQHEKEKDFGETKVLARLKPRGRSRRPRPILGIQEFMDSFDSNVLPHLRLHPNTDFIIFYPPYSILKYKQMHNAGILEKHLELKKHIYTVTKDLGNVKLYDFQVAQEITHDLDNYKDLTHYHQRINSWMLEQIAAGQYRVNEATVGKYNAELISQAENYNLSPGVSDPGPR
ncbi:MAG TPA: hypothetical protein VGL10_06205 [Gammaproteobacteria bacterium]